MILETAQKRRKFPSGSCGHTFPRVVRTIRISLSMLVLAVSWGSLPGPAAAQVIVAHRGASHDAPENTVAAFQEAWRQQADGIEGDFYVTKDHQIVCLHDADTKRTAGKKLLVAESTLEELRQLEYGSWKDSKFRGEPIPLFSDVFATVPKDRLFVIELKTGPEIVPLLKSELLRLQADWKNLLIIAFRKETVQAVRDQLPDVRVHWLTGFKKDKATGVWHPTVAEISEALRTTRASGVGFQGNREVLTPQMLATLKEQGLREFHVWTVDEPADAQHFRDLGAVGITTNRPALIRAAVFSGQ